MPDIVIHFQPQINAEDSAGFSREIDKRMKGMSFAKSCKVTVVHDIFSKCLKDDSKRNPFIRVYSIKQQFLDEIGEALKDLRCEIQFVLLYAGKSATSTDIQYSQ